MTEFYSGFISKNDLCFDIGANMGNRVKIFLEIGAKVIAVEPQANCYKPLRRFYKKNENVVVIPEAVGESEGFSMMFLSEQITISTLSKQWIKNIKKSGRAKNFHWNKKQIVKTTTLDSLIKQYGIPSFIKIDVEGYEFEVLKGLSSPIKALSFEFTPEYFESTFRCLDYLSKLGNYKLNYSMGESVKFELEEWLSFIEMKNILSGLSHNYDIYGDIYAKILL